MIAAVGASGAGAGRAQFCGGVPPERSTGRAAGAEPAPARQQLALGGIVRKPKFRTLLPGCEGGIAALLPAALAPPIRAPVSPAAAPPFRHPQERRVPRSVPIAAAQEARSRARRTTATAPVLGSILSPNPEHSRLETRNRPASGKLH